MPSANGGGLPVLNFGRIYLFEYLFLFAGILLIIKNRVKPENKILLWWLLIFPIASALTLGGENHAFRSVTALPLFEILIAIALIKTLDILNRILKKGSVWMVFIFITLFTLNISVIISYYFNTYKKDYAQDYEYGIKEVVDFIKNKNYEKVIISNESSNQYIISQEFIYVLYYLNYPPQKFQNNVKGIEIGKGGWIFVKSFNKYHFGDIEEEYKKNSKNLFIVREDELKNIPPKKVIYFPNGEIAFKIIIENEIK